MKIIATSDIHYPTCNGKLSTIADRVNSSGADVLVIAGDISSWDYYNYHECLSHFKDFDGMKLAVAGNHDLWIPDIHVKGGSKERYRTLNDVLKKHGFQYLDFEPVIVGSRMGDIGFVGSIGWYDYSFRYTQETPGFSSVLADGINKKLSDLNPRDYDRDGLFFNDSKGNPHSPAGTKDKKMVNLGSSDIEFAELCCDAVRGDIEGLINDVEQIVVVTHMPPFVNMIPEPKSMKQCIMMAYMGNSLLGKTLLEYPKVTTVISGHTHTAGVYQNGHINCYTIGRVKGNPETIDIVLDLSTANL